MAAYVRAMCWSALESASALVGLNASAAAAAASNAGPKALRDVVGEAARMVGSSSLK